MAEKKKKGFFKKIKDALDGDKVKPGFQIFNSTGFSKTRPKTKTNFATKNLKKKVVKGAKDLKRGVMAGIKSPVGAPAKVIGKVIKSAISGGGSKAKAATPKIVPKKKPLSPAQKKKSAAVQKAEDARRAAGKKRAAKKASDTKAADTRDAKRGGFITAKAAKTAGEKSNAKVAANKKRRTDELISRRRK
jgi:hypothetical protein